MLSILRPSWIRRETPRRDDRPMRPTVTQADDKSKFSCAFLVHETPSAAFRPQPTRKLVHETHETTLPKQTDEVGNTDLREFTLIRICGAIDKALPAMDLPSRHTGGRP